MAGFFKKRNKDAELSSVFVFLDIATSKLFEDHDNADKVEIDLFTLSAIGRFILYYAEKSGQQEVDRFSEMTLDMIATATGRPLGALVKTFQSRFVEYGTRIDKMFSGDIDVMTGAPLAEVLNANVFGRESANSSGIPTGVLHGIQLGHMLVSAANQVKSMYH